ncbi:hypothetical protein Plhal304r1_c031g0099551 [Plasmopara halstedii]
MFEPSTCRRFLLQSRFSNFRQAPLSLEAYKIHRIFPLLSCTRCKTNALVRVLCVDWLCVRTTTLLLMTNFKRTDSLLLIQIYWIHMIKV